MAIILDANGNPIDTTDAARAARLQQQFAQPVTGPRGVIPGTPVPTMPISPMTPEQAYSQGRQLTRPAGYNEDVPAYPGETYPLQPLQLSPGVVPAGQEPVTGVRDAAALAGTNQGIATALADARPQTGYLQPADGTNFNMYNTNAAALPQPVGAGIDFGFGVNGAPTATQYLENMRVQDQQTAMDRERGALTDEVMRVQSSITDNSSIGEIGAARNRLSVLQPLLAGQNANQGRVAAANIAGQTAQSTNATELAAREVAAQADAAARLQVADLTGQYGVAAAQAKQQGVVQKAELDATSPAGRKAAAEAALAETQLNAIMAGLQTGQLDPMGVVAASRGGQERAPAIPIDPITGVPYTAEAIALIQQRQLQQLQPQ